MSHGQGLICAVKYHRRKKSLALDCQHGTVNGWLNGETFLFFFLKAITMGLLNSVLDAVSGGGGPDPSKLTGALQSVLSGSGGLGGLVDRFKQKGMENIISGWISTGPNPPITGEQLQGVLGADAIGKLAGSLGVDGSQASSLLAKFLPDVIDKLTPNGKIEPGVNVEQGLAGLLPGLLQGGLGKLLGGK